MFTADDTLHYFSSIGSVNMIHRAVNGAIILEVTIPRVLSMSIRIQPALATQYIAVYRAQQPRSLKLKALPFALVTAAGLSLGLVSAGAQAGTIVVTSTGDAPSPNASGCTLRDAINSMSSGSLLVGTGCVVTGTAIGTSSDDTITFGGVTTVLLTESSLLTVSRVNPLLIRGAGQGGVTIQRTSVASNGLIQQYGGDLTLDGLTLTGGSQRAGAAVDVEAYSSNAFLRIKNSVISGNNAGSNFGGGISAYSRASNTVATVSITDSTLSGNSASNGGGIFLGGPSVLNVTGSTLSGNTASSDGGGIYMNSTGSTVAVANSTLSGNSAFCYGAGLFNPSSNANTFPAVSFTSSTVTLNSTSGECSNGAGVTHYGGSLTLNNTIMAGNTRGSTPADIALYGRSAVNVLGSNNLVQNVASGITFTNAPLTSDPLLGPLQNNGGPTLTHALLTGSPAINAGSSTSSLTTDQRGAGFQRVVGTAVDIGAIESPINGACGSASSSTPVLAQPTTNLCSAGTATAVSGPQPYTWGCNGIGGGSTSTAATACSVPVQQWTVTPYVATGPASGSINPSTAQTVNQNASTSFVLTPASGYAAGTAIGCNGTLAGATYTTGSIFGNCNVIASFTLTPINGSCGISSGTTSITAPTANLCSTGTATTVSGVLGGPWAWSCTPNATGTSTANCATNIQTYTANALVSGGNGSVSGPSTQTVNYNTATNFSFTPSSGYQLASVTGCGSGSLSGGTYSTAALLSNCNVVATFSLIPIDGKCGSAHLLSVDSAPTANLCSTGNATAVTLVGSAYRWTCNPNATSTASAACFATIKSYTATSSVTSGNGAFDASSRNANYNTTTSFIVTPSAGYSIGSVGGSCGGSLSGNTYTTAPMTANCAVTATFTLVPVNGACGAASSSTPALSTPLSNLCSSGTATAVAGTGPWTWGCNGSGVGGTSTAATACTLAIKTWAVTPSVSGGNGTISPSTVVTVNNNAATSFTVTPSSGYNIASVVGCSGVRSGATFNIAAVTADCAVVAMFSAVPRAVIALSGNAIPIANGATTPLIADGTDFGSLVIGQSLLRSFTITNSGTTTLTITGLSFTGADAADFTITSPTVFPVTINASASTTISVRFTPRATGPRSASLLIAYDDGAASGSASEARLKAAGNAGFALQGIGVAAAESLPVPAWGLGGLMASLLGLLLAGVAGLRRSGKR